jgi:predicted esterase
MLSASVTNLHFQAARVENRLKATNTNATIKIWQGTADAVVDPVFVEEYVRSVRRSGSYIELHMMENIGHCYTSAMCTELLYWFNRFA